MKQSPTVHPAKRHVNDWVWQSELIIAGNSGKSKQTLMKMVDRLRIIQTQEISFRTRQGIKSLRSVTSLSMQAKHRVRLYQTLQIREPTSLPNQLSIVFCGKKKCRIILLPVPFFRSLWPKHSRLGSLRRRKCRTCQRTNPTDLPKAGTCKQWQPLCREPVQDIKVSTRLAAERVCNAAGGTRVVSLFVQWYNYEHHHSGLKFLTPDQRRSGKSQEILEKWHQVYPVCDNSWHWPAKNVGFWQIWHLT